MTKAKIYIFATPVSGYMDPSSAIDAPIEFFVGDVRGHAVSEDGESLAGHLSSCIGWCRHDMGLDGSDWKHDVYAKKYPDGYELEWVDDWTKHPFLVEIDRRNREKVS